MLFSYCSLDRSGFDPRTKIKETDSDSTIPIRCVFKELLVKYFHIHTYLLLLLLLYHLICYSDSENERNHQKRRKCNTHTSEDEEWSFRKVKKQKATDDDEEINSNNRKQHYRFRQKTRTQKIQPSDLDDSEDDESIPVLVMEKSPQTSCSSYEQGKSISGNRQQVRHEYEYCKASTSNQGRKTLFLDSSDSEDQNTLISRKKECLNREKSSTEGEENEAPESSNSTILDRLSSTCGTRSYHKKSNERNVQLRDSVDSSPDEDLGIEATVMSLSESNDDSLIVEHSSGGRKGAKDDNFDHDSEDFGTWSDDGLHCRGPLDNSVSGIRPLQAVKPQSGSVPSVSNSTAQSTLSLSLTNAPKEVASQTSTKTQIKDASMQWECADPVLVEGGCQTDPVLVRPLLVTIENNLHSSDTSSPPVTRQSSKEIKESPATFLLSKKRESSLTAILSSKGSEPDTHSICITGKEASSSSQISKKIDMKNEIESPQISNKTQHSPGCPTKLIGKPSQSFPPFKKICSPSSRMDRSSTSIDRCTRQSDRKTRSSSKHSFQNSFGVLSPKYRHPKNI